MAVPGGTALGEWVTVGIDNGGTSNNGTILDSRGNFLVDTLVELPSLVREGPGKAIGALADTVDKVLTLSGQRGGRAGLQGRHELRPSRVGWF